MSVSQSFHRRMSQDEMININQKLVNLCHFTSSGRGKKYPERPLLFCKSIFMARTFFVCTCSDMLRSLEGR